MTSNLGGEFLVNLGEGQDVDVVRDEIMNLVKATFRPEFLNRADKELFADCPVLTCSGKMSRLF